MFAFIVIGSVIVFTAISILNSSKNGYKGKSVSSIDYDDQQAYYNRKNGTWTVVPPNQSDWGDNDS